MTILAGIMSRNTSVKLQTTHCEFITRSLSRFPEDNVFEFRTPRAFLAKVDIGTYLEPGVLLSKTGSMTMLAGEPLLVTAHEESHAGRGGLSTLQKHWDAGEWNSTSLTRGVFCAVHYEPTKNRISLIADRLGIRPLYYWVGKEYIVFSTALRILEEFCEVPKVMNLRAVTEIACFGFPLGNRTPYSEIYVMKAGEVVQIDDNGVSSRQYWRWDHLEQPSLSYQNLLNEAYSRFTEAIQIRLRTDSSGIAFLSGGLDSRCVVSGLHSKNVKLHTFNFAVPHTQDHVFGAEVAKQLGAFHTEAPIEPGSDVSGYGRTLSRAWFSSKYRSSNPVQRPGLVWSGEGGSVGVGNVYVYQKVLDLLRSGKLDNAIDEFLRRGYFDVPSKLFIAKISHRLARVPKEGILEELKDIHSEDPGRGFHLFLMLNDQRRHLRDHFENIDLHRIELHLPFFDGHFLELVLSARIDYFLEHRFYNDWLGCFPSWVATVPWQSYPGHAQCPLPIPDALIDQWRNVSRLPARKRCKRLLIRQVLNGLISKDFPNEILARFPLGGAALLTLAGFRDYMYVLKTARLIYDFWKKCNGRYDVLGTEGRC